MEARDLIFYASGGLTLGWAFVQILNVKELGEAIRETHPDCYKEHPNKL